MPKRQPTMRLPQSDNVPSMPRRPTMLQAPLKEVRSFHVRPSKPEPPTQPAVPRLRYRPKQQKSMDAIEMKKTDYSSGDSEGYGYADFNEPTSRYRTDTQMTMAGSTHALGGKETEIESPPRREDTLSPLPHFGVELQDNGVQRQGSMRKGRRSHFSIKEPQGFSLSRSHKRAPIARDWSISRKRWTATIACVSTALLGIIVGIYAGEVPAIQYTIADEHHYTILGNVVFFIGLAITTVLFFPLPLLHGRKPYTMAALAILLPLQFPQALIVNTQRSPSVATYRAGLLLSRAAAGLVMGLANINFLATLLDLFGSSLQSSNPHQELVDANDVRRHGGGMGMWLGIWTWCFIGSIGLGFLIGAVIISGLEVAWGFWITIILTAAVVVLNVLTPETRRSAYRRSLAEVRNGGEVSRRVARGEMKMHIDATGPIFWWEEVVAGWRICVRMLKQPGFVVLSLYLGWIYGQIVLIIVVSSSCLQSRNILILYIAIRRPHLQILSLPSAVCWTFSGCYTYWCPPRNSIPEGLAFQSCKDRETQDRQHDNSKTCDSILALHSKSRLYDTPTIRWFNLHTVFWWTSHQFHGTNRVCRHYWLSVQSGHCRVQRHNHGDLRYIGPPTRYDRQTPQGITGRGNEKANQLLLFPSCYGSICNLTIVRFFDRGSRHRYWGRDREEAGRPNSFGSGRWHTVGINTTADSSAYSLQDCANHTYAAVRNQHSLWRRGRMEARDYRSSQR